MRLRGTISPTDRSWYEFLRTHPRPEVNFWTPSDRRRFDAPRFSPYLFKLKAPGGRRLRAVLDVLEW